MKVVVAGREDEHLRDDLRWEGAEILAVVPATAPAVAVVSTDPAAEATITLLVDADLLVLDAEPGALTPGLVAACDRFGVRIVVRCDDERAARTARAYGVSVVPGDASAATILHPLVSEGDDDLAVVAPPRSGRVIAVWGAAGAPGRTTVAIELADADAHNPSIALSTGLIDEGPGFAAACRQFSRGALTPDEVQRIAQPLGQVSVLVGINRPARWPELAADRVKGALDVCRSWADDVVVDVASALETDEEIVSDLDGPRRNAATLAVLESADVVVAVVAADPVGVARFLRAYADLRALVPAAPIRVLVNKTRPGALGIDPRAQVRRALERYAEFDEVWFAPWDRRATDAALLSAAPVRRAVGRSSWAGAVCRFADEALERPTAPRVARLPRRGRRTRRTAESSPRRPERAARIGSADG